MELRNQSLNCAVSCIIKAISLGTLTSFPLLMNAHHCGRTPLSMLCTGCENVQVKDGGFSVTDGLFPVWGSFCCLILPE